MTHLTLLHTNDIHGRVHQITRIASLVKQTKNASRADGGYCLYLDSGDSEDTVLLESSLTKGSVMGTIMRGAGCDQMTLGNAVPLRYGSQAIREEANCFGKPILCANLFDESGKLIEGLVPYQIMTCGNLDIAIIGVTAPIETYRKAYNLQPIQPAEILPDLISRARREGAKTVVILSHIASPEDIKLAETISGINIILGGHDHKVIFPPQTINGCLVVQSGEYGQFLGRFDLDIDENTGTILNYSGELLPVNDEITEDETTLKAIHSESIRIETLMTKIVGKLEIPLDLEFDRECAAGNLLADALLTRFTDAQFSFVLAGQWTSGIKAGRITAKDIFSANRSSANPARAVLTGAQVYAFLREALKPGNAERELHALRGGKVGWPHVSGIEVVWSGRSADSLEIFFNGKLLDPEQGYIVAATDMEFADFIGYLSIDDTQVQYEVPTIIPEVLEDYLSEHTPLLSVMGDRIRVKK